MKVALQFSGGRDSLALLYLMKPWWDETLVTWTNTGAAYTSTIELMNNIRSLVPHFLEIKTNQPMQVALYGYPTDVVPLHCTFGGHAYHGPKNIMLQDSFSCCNANIWQPMHEAMKRRGITTILRGQRRGERYKNPLPGGTVVDGITVLYPIEGWTTQRVDWFLKDNNVEIPSYYATELKSHDCWSCTGYLDEDGGRIANLPLEQRLVVQDRLQRIYETTLVEMQPLYDIVKQ